MNATTLNSVKSSVDEDTTVSEEIKESNFLIIVLVKALLIRFDQGRERIDLNVAMLLCREALKRRSLPHDSRHACLISLAKALKYRFEEGRRQGDLDESIYLDREAHELQPPLPPPFRSEHLSDLASSLITRFNQRGQEADLDEAINLYKQAIDFSLLPDSERVPPINKQPLPPPYRSERLNDLASSLITRFRQRRQEADLDEAITLYRQAINFSLGLTDSERAVPVNNLAAALVARSERGGQRTDLDEAISLHKQALELRPPFHPERSASLYNLADAMFTRSMFDEGGKAVDLNEAISIHRQALELRAPSHPSRWDSLTNLEIALFTRFQQGGRQSDLEEAISLRRQSLQLRLSPHPNRYMSLCHLAEGLEARRTQFLQADHRTDLDEVVCLYKEALELVPTPHPHRYTCLNNVADALRTRFEQGGQGTDLDEAILMHKEALQLRPSPHTERFDTIHNLAIVLFARFEQVGQQIDLDEAVSLNREALELRPSPHPDRSMSLNSLASVLGNRFRQTGQKSDLDEAIFLHREALELVPSPHPDRFLHLNNIANMLWTRSTKGDLEEAVSIHREVVQLRLPHSDRSTSLSNLATVLLDRFIRGGQQTDLDEAICLNTEALQLRPSPHPDRYMSLTSLASALEARFRQRGQRIDLDEAISLTRQALLVDLQSPLHPGRPKALFGLGEFLIKAHRLHDNNSEYLENAMSSFAAATQCLSQSPSQCLLIAKKWALHAKAYEHTSAIDAYEVALQTLPRVAALSFDVQSRQEALTANSDGLARDASTFALLSGNLGKAIEFLEAGRTIFWSQVLSLRSSFDQLSNVAPGLANNLRNIAIALELGSHRDVSPHISNNMNNLSLDQEVFRLNRLNEEWEKAIDDTRKVDGFEDFLRPYRLSSLQSAASEHPIVFLVDNDSYGDCLIMTSTSIRYIPLKILCTEVLRELVYFVQVAACQWQVSRSAIEKSHRKVLEHLGERRGMRFEDDVLGNSDGIFRFVLRVLWHFIVKPVIGILDVKKSDEMPILQWCPTGAFTFLPIHAAGHYRAYNDKVAIESASESASDYFISTYIPSISAGFTHRPAPSTQKFKMMAVIQSSELPSTKRELEHLQRHVPNTSLVIFGIPGAVANVEVVASHLSDASIVHFACHGKQDRKKPLDSGLTLDDGLLKISRIMKEKIPSGSLAFLCACETAMGDHKLPDEAMSLGASFGFRRVVATMWEMRDEDGPTIADIFYEELFRGPDGKPVPEPDTTRSAQALHVAVKKLRSQNVGFIRWVPFIHMGT